MTYFLKIVSPSTKAKTHNPRNIANKTFAIEAAPSEMPVNPNIAATIAIRKKVADHFNIFLFFIY
jgi:hypothetical protein